MKKIVVILALALAGVFGYQNSPIALHNLTAAGSLIEAPGENFGTVMFQVSGTWVGTITFEGTVNGSWVAINATNVNTTSAATTATANGLYWVSTVGLTKVRARMSAYTSGTAAVSGVAVDGIPAASLSSSGSGGAVTQSGTWTVQPGNTANTTAWLVTGTGGTFPVTFSTTGSGNATGALRVELANNGTGVLGTVGAVTAITNALPAGSNIIGNFRIDQTTPGTTNAVQANAGTNLNTSALSLDASTVAQTMVDNAAFTDGTTRVNPSGYIFDEVAGTALTENDGAAARVDSKRAQVMVFEDATTRGQRAAISAAGAIANNLAQVAGATVATGHGTASGSIRVELPTDGTGVLATVGAVTAITNALPAGSNAIGTVTAVGAAAHGASVSGNPILNGLEARTTEGTAVTSGQVVRAQGTIEGKTVVQEIAIRASTWSSAAAAGGLVTTSGVTAKAAAGAGIRNCVDGAQIINSHQTIGSEVVIRDGAAGTVMWRGWAQFTGGGSAQQFRPPLCGTANTLIEIAEVTTTGTAGVLVNLQGHVTAE